jgi:signal peptidase II
MSAPETAEPVRRSSGGRRPALFYSVALLVFVLDQSTKLLAVRHLEIGRPVPVLGPVLSLNLRENTGAAWGLLAQHSLWLAVIGVAMVVGLVVAGLRAGQMPAWMRTALPVLLGGAMGNVADRVGRGAVIDFLDFHVWPVFNLADTAIVVSAVLICYSLIVAEVKGTGTEPDDAGRDGEAECDQC